MRDGWVKIKLHVKNSPIDACVLLMCTIISAILAFGAFSEGVAIAAEKHPIKLSFLWVFASVVVSDSVVVYKKIFNKDVASCIYRRDLLGCGILKVYPDSSCDDCMKDIAYDLSTCHKDSNVIFMGVSMRNWFDNSSPIYKVLLKRKNELNDIKVFMCCEDNYELVQRTHIVEGIVESSNGKLKRESGADPAKYIENVKDGLWRIVDSENVVQYRQISPFAMICSVGSHIYYRPNVMNLENYGIVTEENNIERANLTLLIDESSRFGKRISELLSKVYTEETIKKLDNKK